MPPPWAYSSSGDQGVGDTSAAVLGRDEEPLQFADAALSQLDAAKPHEPTSDTSSDTRYTWLCSSCVTE